MGQMWAWLHLHCEHRWAVGVHGPFKSLVTGPWLLGNCYLKNKFHKNQGDPLPLLI